MRIADTAEPYEIVGKLLETGWERQHLLSGDYYFTTYTNQRLVVTRKTTSDLVNSIFISDNHCKELGKHPFVQQLEEMLEQYDMHKILIEGSWLLVMSDDKTRTCVQSFLSRWQDKGYSLLLSANNEMTVKILNEQYALYQKPYSLSGNTKGFYDDRVLAFPSGCRGETAYNCLKHFGTLANIMQASALELTSINGIGEKRANLIYYHFHREVIR